MSILEKIENTKIHRENLEKVLNEKFFHLDEDFKNIIIKYGDLFDTDFVGKGNLEKRWLESEDSMHKFFAASYMLGQKVKNNQLDKESINEVKEAFLNSAMEKKREAFEADDEDLYEESFEIEILSDNVKTLVKVWQSL